MTAEHQLKFFIKKVFHALVFSTTYLCAVVSHGELTIEITQGVQDPTPIAVVPFGGAAASAPEDLSGIIAADLRRSRVGLPGSSF